MGASSSSIGELKDNEYLRRFSGKESITHNDPFWNQFLSFTFHPPKTSSEYRLLDESTQSLCKTLLTNNLQTGNFGALLRVFLTRAAELKASAQCENNIFTWQTYNALFILKCLSKFLIETITEENVIRQFQASCTSPNGNANDQSVDECEDPLIELFQNSLVEILVDVPLSDVTSIIHLEAINTLLVLLSVQMFSQKPASKSVVYRAMMSGKWYDNSIHACLLLKTLLQHYVRQEKCTDPNSREDSRGSFILGLASGLWTALSLGYSRNSRAVEEPLLAKQSLLLVLILANHCTSDKVVHNPYRQALFSFTDSQDSTGSSPTHAVATFKLDYSKLYSTLCQTLTDDQTTLLLYLLLHRNHHLRNYILAKADIEELIVPILKILYQAQERNSHHIYMALIILLILSEDDLFNKTVHDITLKNLTWYTERSLSSMSLGGILVLVVIRTIQYNMAQMRDKYLHTNCLAALANMSSHFKGLHPYVTQRLVSLFESLAKRHARIVEQIRGSGRGQDAEEEDTVADLMQDLAVLEEVLRMVLEIVNSCISSQISHNPNLIYTLLYKRECFEQFRTHPTFQDIIQNIDTVLTYFSQRMENSDKDLSVQEVLEIIQQGALQWPGDRLKKFPDLKFKYVEEDQPEEFFLPYIWSLVYQSSNLYWNSSCVRIFNPDKLTATPT